MEAVECGAAALAIVLAYFKRWVPLEELRHECGVSRDGSKASNVLKAARKYGLDAKGFKYDEIEKLFDLPLPVILFWNLNHFIVLEGFRGNRVYINDPAQGPRVVTMEELDGSYSGVVLTFERTKEYQKGGQKPGIAGALARRLKGSEMALLFTVLSGLFLVVPGLVIPTFTRVFIDKYLLGGQERIVNVLVFSMILAILVQACLSWLQEYCLLRLETKLAVKTSSGFFNHIVRLPASYFAQRYSGEIGSRLGINDRVANIISGRLATTMIDSVMTVFYAVLMWQYDAKLTVIVILIALVNVVAVRLVARGRVDASRSLTQDKGKLMGTSMSGLQMIETLKATGSEAVFFGRWSGYYAKTMNTEQFLSILSQGVSVVPAIVETTSRAAVLVLGGIGVMEGRLTVGLLVAYQTLLQSFTRPLNNFVQFGATVQELQADMNRIDDVLRNKTDPVYDETVPKEHFDSTTVKLTGRVELRGVKFGYSPLDKPLIGLHEDFNLVIEPGQRVAFVGSSGSGKSTIAKLISGLYQPWEGEILFDGVPRQRIPRELLVNSVAVVDQDLFMFGGTLTENVSMWDPSISNARVSTACRDAAIAGVIEAREGGYQTPVREGGGNFSGGQCQRIEIARALVGEPTILILDEATSALDPSTEAIIDEAIRRRGCTTIIIAHRLSTIRDCDEIVVLDRGEVVQRGTHQSMKDVDGPYKTLISV